MGKCGECAGGGGVKHLHEQTGGADDHAGDESGCCGRWLKRVWEVVETCVGGS